MDNFHNLCINRRSIRKYTDQPISPEDVKTIIEAGLMAPTSKSARAWQFIVIEDRDMMARVAELKPQYQTSLKTAPLAIVVGVDTTRTDPWIEDASVAATFMQLQAADLGLGSCWVQVRGRYTADDTPSEDYLQELLGIPETVSIVCVLTFGHKDEERRPIDTDKLLWENVHIGKW
ncbi:MAG: NAD(P)H nitroreductase [Bacteroidales bacterium]|nr:NAD(P)H nitroreductase [Bacteroidales bacterium]MBD5245489.1 NAD(P)H nitroreductase [Barnesiella sp.]